MDRFWPHFPAALTFFLIGLAYFVTILILKKRCGEKLDDIEWIVEHLRPVQALNLCAILLAAPAAEELIFRLPLLLVAPELNAGAWPWIVFSGALFGLVHFLQAPEVLAKLGVLIAEGIFDDLDTTSIKAARREYLRRHRRRYRLHLACRVTSATVLGILIGWLAVRHQSLWLAGGVHAAWNALPFALVLLVMLIRRFIGLLPTKKNRRRRRMREIDRMITRNTREATNILCVHVPAASSHEERQELFDHAGILRQESRGLMDEFRALMDEERGRTDNER